jgi:hypothetical protein
VNITIRRLGSGGAGPPAAFAARSTTELRKGAATAAPPRPRNTRLRLSFCGIFLELVRADELIGGSLSAHRDVTREKTQPPQA